MIATKELVERGRFLRNAAPREFVAFCEAFDRYANTVLATVLMPVGEELPRVQGHAQQCVKISQLLEEIKNG